jgi:hypothetical protein
MHALFKTKVEYKMTCKRRIIFFARFQFESDDHGISNNPGRRDGANSFTADARRESLARLHIYPRRSSNANCLCCAGSPNWREIIA